MEFFPSNLKYLRTKNNLSQAALGKIIGKASNTITQWESGDRQPKIDFLIAIAYYFEVDLNDLMHVDLSQKSTSSTTVVTYPDMFTLEDVELARRFLSEMPTVFAFGGYDYNKMLDEQIIELVNMVQTQLNMVGTTFKSKLDYDWEDKK